MLSGIYGYIFGSEDSNDSCTSNGSCESTSVNFENSRVEEDWLFVQKAISGRSSPVLVALPELRDIDELSFASKKAEHVPEPDYATVIRLAELKKAKARNAQKLQLEKALFADVEPSSPAQIKTTKSSKLKKSTSVINHVHDTKTKRSKKSGKASSNVSNDRKVNNID